MARKYYPACSEHIAGVELIWLPHGDPSNLGRFEVTYRSVLPALDRYYWLAWDDCLNYVAEEIRSMLPRPDDGVVALAPGTLSRIASAPPRDEEGGLALWGYRTQPSDPGAEARNWNSWPHSSPSLLDALIDEGEEGNFFFSRDAALVDLLEADLHHSKIWFTNRTTLKDAWDRLEALESAR